MLIFFTSGCLGETLVPINVGSTLAGFCRFFFNESGDDPPLKRSVFYVQLAVVVCVCVLVSQGCVEKKNAEVGMRSTQQ